MPVTPEHRIAVHLDELLEANEMTLVELSSRVGVTVANLSILKNSPAKAAPPATCSACTPEPGLAERLDAPGHFLAVTASLTLGT